ncbi:recombinase family protein [Pseudomonas stutzeri]|uniref:Recombinase family protein n=1 Tax=Stutzerimonas stutzeri TaxID=316 RepID=A0A2N8RYZ0_STUST|nr:recombinase family protein [Stutzerimonas stutzeri]MCQ4297466.1 recombinase family protein [Stutzerimonas stutzeri]PNF79604.1 recombinase family protein [Stutzerimonas stutzeri]
MAGKVYSYLRFSDPRQAAGSSADRQLQYAQRWAAERGFVLDESLSLRDEGLSAYHQQHVKQGALGAFLKAVDEGRIPSGSVLIVEGLDRLSRAEPIQAQAQLAQIINAGITVVTASDGREYNRAGLKAQPMDLVYSLLVMIRAHEESDTKSKRVKASIRRLCEGWQADTYRGLIRNGRDPQWLRWDGQAWQLLPERVEAVRYALELYKKGEGATRVVRKMEERGYVLSDWGLGGQQIYRLIKLPALRGAKRVSIDGEDFLLEGYYPPLLSDDEYHELQAVTDKRHGRRGASDIVGIVTGIGITWCGYCGTAVTAQNQISRAREDGTLNDGHRRLHCSSYSSSTGCKAASCSVVPVEKAVLAYCADQMNLTRLLEPTDDGQQVRQRLQACLRKQGEVERQLARVTEALLADDGGAAPLAFVRKARELEAELQQLHVEAERLELEQAVQGKVQTPAAAEQWAQLAADSQDIYSPAREQLRQLVLDTFSRIVVYMRGVVLDPKSKTIAVMLVSRAGQRVMLEVDRRSGAWKASRDRSA